MTVSTYIIQYFRRSVKNSKAPHPTNSFLMRLWRLPALSASVHSAAGLPAPRFAWDTNFPSLSAVHRKPQPLSSPPRFAEGLKPFSPLLGSLKASFSLPPLLGSRGGVGGGVPLTAACRRKAATITAKPCISSAPRAAYHQRTALHIISPKGCISSSRRLA